MSHIRCSVCQCEPVWTVRGSHVTRECRITGSGSTNTRTCDRCSSNVAVNGRILLQDVQWRHIRRVPDRTQEGVVTAGEEEEIRADAVARRPKKSITVSRETVARRQEDAVSAAQEILHALETVTHTEMNVYCTLLYSRHYINNSEHSPGLYIRLLWNINNFHTSTAMADKLKKRTQHINMSTASLLKSYETLKKYIYTTQEKTCFDES